jgi:hypothetical protein
VHVVCVVGGPYEPDLLVVMTLILIVRDVLVGIWSSREWCTIVVPDKVAFRLFWHRSEEMCP